MYFDLCFIILHLDSWCDFPIQASPPSNIPRVCSVRSGCDPRIFQCAARGARRRWVAARDSGGSAATPGMARSCLASAQRRLGSVAVASSAGKGGGVLACVWESVAIRVAGGGQEFGASPQDWFPIRNWTLRLSSVNQRKRNYTNNVSKALPGCDKLSV